jgi:hypothetical protein
VLVDSSGVGSMRWVVGVGAAGSVEGLVACPEGFSLRTLKVPLRTTGSRWTIEHHAGLGPGSIGSGVAADISLSNAR